MLGPLFPGSQIFFPPCLFPCSGGTHSPYTLWKGIQKMKFLKLWMSDNPTPIFNWLFQNSKLENIFAQKALFHHLLASSAAIPILVSLYAICFFSLEACRSFSFHVLKLYTSVFGLGLFLSTGLGTRWILSILKTHTHISQLWETFFNNSFVNFLILPSPHSYFLFLKLLIIIAWDFLGCHLVFLYFLYCFPSLCL